MNDLHNTSGRWMKSPNNDRLALAKARRGYSNHFRYLFSIWVIPFQFRGPEIIFLNNVNLFIKQSLNRNEIYKPPRGEILNKRVSIARLNNQENELRWHYRPIRVIPLDQSEGEQSRTGHVGRCPLRHSPAIKPYNNKACERHLRCFISYRLPCRVNIVI